MKKIIILLSTLLICTVSLFAKNEGTVLQNDAVLWAKGSDGVMAWDSKSSAYIPAGTILEYVSDTVIVADLKTSQGTDKNIKFINVKHNGKSLYILANRFSLGNKVSVITKESVLFTKATLQSFRNSYLEAGTIVVNLGDYSSPVCNFTKVEFYDKDAYTIRTRYVLDTNLSNDKNDIKAMQILTKIAATKDDTMKQELASSALNLSTSSFIRPIVQKEYNKIFGIAEEFEEPEPEAEAEAPADEGNNVEGKYFEDW